jgi:hypothetical protein
MSDTLDRPRPVLRYRHRTLAPARNGVTDPLRRARASQDVSDQLRRLAALAEHDPGARAVLHFVTGMITRTLEDLDGTKGGV